MSVAMATTSYTKATSRLGYPLHMLRHLPYLLKYDAHYVTEMRIHGPGHRDRVFLKRLDRGHFAGIDLQATELDKRPYRETVLYVASVTARTTKRQYRQQHRSKQAVGIKLIYSDASQY